jgi:hypothetical protein
MKVTNITELPVESQNASKHLTEYRVIEQPIEHATDVGKP